MGQQVIRQPNGKFAIFSSYTDTIIVWDATAEEIMQHFVDQAIADTKRQVGRILEAVMAEESDQVYHQFAMTWDEALEIDRDGGGTVGEEWTP